VAKIKRSVYEPVSPIYDAGWSKFTEAQQAGELRGRIAEREAIVALIRKIARPSTQMLVLLKEIESRWS
jgi:hypothetical protein